MIACFLCQLDWNQFHNKGEHRLAEKKDVEATFLYNLQVKISCQTEATHR